MNNLFIPFLRGKKINALEKIDAELISRFQDYLLDHRELKPQTVNDYLSGVKKVFAYLCGKGKLANNPFNNVWNLTVSDGDKKAVGCHEVEKLKSVFSAEWSDKLSYILCLLVYSTGLRDNEIEKLKVEDIINIDGCAFLDIRESKTRNGVRLAPLHNFVKSRLVNYIKENKRDNYIFTRNGNHLQSTVYREANTALARKLRVPEAEIERQNIQFHSGRHFWKTLMNSENLGEDIEEVFMGHKVSSDVAKRYNHKDKQGKARKLEKARRVFAILDRTLFAV